jgi:hypothetical protein
MMSDEAALHETAGRQISVWHLSQPRLAPSNIGQDSASATSARSMKKVFGKLSVEGDAERLSLDAWGAVVS